jgi:hypothetical protein
MVNELLQIIAVLIRRSGGEVLISKIEFDIVEDVPVKFRWETPEVISLFIPENEHEDTEEDG